MNEILFPILGPQGIQGLKGQKGELGFTGPEGPKGLEGRTIFLKINHYFFICSWNKKIYKHNHEKWRFLD